MDNSYELTLPKKTSFAATDYLRMVVGGVSSDILPQAFATEIADYLPTLVNSVKIRAAAVSGNILTTDSIVLASAGTTQTLPNPTTAFTASSSKSNQFTVVNAGSGSAVTVNPYNTENIKYNGDQSSISLAAGASMTFATDGTDWYGYNA